MGGLSPSVRTTPFIAAIELLLAISLAEGCVFVGEVDGLIDAGTSEYLRSLLSEAERKGCDAIILLDTPGGLLVPTEEIVKRIFPEFKGRVAVFVHREGGWAYSAGTYILLAADVAIAHPNAGLGAAQPRPADEKTIGAMASWLESIAKAKGRNATLAKRLVTEANLSLTGKEAYELGLIDATATSLEEAIEKAGMKGAVHFREPSPKDKLFSFLSHPQVISLLFLIGFFGLLYVLKTGDPTLLPLPLAALVILFWSLGVIKFSTMGLALILLGLVLIAIEILNPGITVFGFAGIVCLVLGMLTIEAEPLRGERWIDELALFTIGAAVGLGAFFVLLLKKVAEIKFRKAYTGAEALIGEIGEVVEELRPKGLVRVKTERWTAESLDGSPIGKGEKVRIVEVRGNTLYVRLFKEKE